MSDAERGERIRVGRTGSVAVLTLDHPPTRNAINQRTLQQLARILTQVRHDPGVGAVLLTAAGPHFCSGADIKEPLPTQAELTRQQPGRHPATLLHSFPRPTVTAIHGCCIGGGLELALATDIRIAAADAWFRFAEITVGLPTGWGGGTLLAQVVGRGRALDLLLSGRWVDAAEALAMGLVTRIAPAGDLQAEALTLAAELAGRAPAAVRAIKAAVQCTGFPGVLAAEVRHFGIAAASPEAAQLIEEFLAQRRKHS